MYLDRPLKKLVTNYQETNQFQRAEMLFREVIKGNTIKKCLYVKLGYYNHERQQNLLKCWLRKGRGNHLFCLIHNENPQRFG